MKNLFLSLSLATLSLFAVASCKTNDPTPATTSTIVGEYKLTGTETFTTNGKSATSGVNATLFVMGTSTPNKYYFLERYGTQEAGYFVTVNGQTLQMETIVDEVYPDGNNRWIGNRTSSGKVDGKTITYQSQTPSFEVLNFGVLYNKVQPTTINSMSRKVDFVATVK